MLITMFRLVALFAFAAAVHAAEIPESPHRLPRTNLLVYRARDGKVSQVKSIRDWQKRRTEIVRGMQQVMGPLPGKSKRCQLEMQVEEEKDCGDYIRRSITYSSEPGSRVPAYLLIPKRALDSDKKFPAVLALHPTDMEYGNRVLVEQLRPHYRAYANELAEHGFVVLAPAYPLMANYQPDLVALGYQSGTMKAVWDNVRGLDLLDSLPFVKHRKYGVLGHSLGGHNALFTAVFDERLGVVITSCGFDSFLDYMDGNIKGWTSQRYMPQLIDYQANLEAVPFDFPEIIAALAPRTVFVNAPLGDTNFKWRSVDEIIKAAWPVYRLFRESQNLQVEHPDCGHDFPAEIRDRAYSVLANEMR